MLIQPSAAGTQARPCYQKGRRGRPSIGGLIRGLQMAHRIPHGARVHAVHTAHGACIIGYVCEFNIPQRGILFEGTVERNHACHSSAITGPARQSLADAVVDVHHYAAQIAE